MMMKETCGLMIFVVQISLDQKMFSPYIQTKTNKQKSCKKKKNSINFGLFDFK